MPGPGGRTHAPPTLCKAVAFSERKREMSSAEADTLHASTICPETVHTAAVLSGTRSFLTDITAHRLDGADVLRGRVRLTAVKGVSRSRLDPAVTAVGSSDYLDSQGLRQPDS